MRTTSILAAAVSLTLSQQLPAPPPPPSVSAQPPRDVVRRQTPDPVGTAIIRGRVMAADTGTPIRRASVMLTGAPPLSGGAGTIGGVVGGVTGGVATNMTSFVVNGAPVQVAAGMSFMGRPRTTTTDAQGNFEFLNLPAGSYRLRASPGQYAAQYLAFAYGAKKVEASGGDPGQTIQLSDGQTFDKATIALPKGSVITGRVTDENGDALARVQVYTMFFPAGSSRGQRTGAGASTDDLGQFRLFGLAPGEYTVVAEARGNTYVPPNAPAETEEERIGFLTTYYPGTPDEGAAQRVRVRAGGEAAGIEIRMSTGRLLHITGMVVDSQGRATRASVMLMRRSTNGVMSGSFGIGSDDEGHFQMRAVPPGEYRLTARQMIMSPPGANGRLAQEQAEFATIPISLATDLENVLLTTGPGATITGQVVFENGPPQLPSSQSTLQVRVMASPADPMNMMGAPSPQPALVSPDMTFTMKGLMGEYLLRANVNAQGQVTKAVLLGGTEDISDVPHEFKNGERVTIVLTSRASTIEGNLTDDKGALVTDGTIMLFSENKAAWRMNSMHTRRSGPDPNGHFRLMGVLPGRYYIIATPRERLNVPSPDSSFFEQLAKEATTVVVGEDEQRTVDLKVVTAGGGS